MGMFLYPSNEEGLAWLQAISRPPSWYIGTDEYERNAREAEAEFRELLAAYRDENPSS